ncbi:MAG: PLP-dependent transferase [Chitinispirillaceae bacterium]|jgi:cystathionine beta-lyase/cystathionine gamma-synthase
MRFATKLVHEGQEPDPATGAVNTPLCLSSTFKQDGIGMTRQGYEYSRSNNPSRQSLEKTIAGIENGKYGLCFGSGSAATTAVLNLLEPGDEVLTTGDIYGGTYRLLSRVYAKYGIKTWFLPTHSAEKLFAGISDKARLIWIESPTNPLLNIIDIAEVTRLKNEVVASGHGEIIIAVDNTFASPYFQNPLDLGADVVVHSTTKYLGGHSDVIGGAIVTNNDHLFKQCRFYQNAAGGVPSPFDCYLVQRGIKTLALRMEKHQSNAFAVAEILRQHVHVEKVFFPGFDDHPGFSIVRKQMRGVPGMISFMLRGGRNEVERFFGRLEIITLAESLGGVESLVCHPFTMTHGSIPSKEKTLIGITENLVRLSVGIEDKDDLIEDLLQALH